MVQLAVVLYTSLGAVLAIYTKLEKVVDCYIINPRLHACAARVIVVGLCVCVCVGYWGKKRKIVLDCGRSVPTSPRVAS